MRARQRPPLGEACKSSPLPAQGLRISLRLIDGTTRLLTLVPGLEVDARNAEATFLEATELSEAAYAE